MAAVDPFALFDEPADGIFFAALLTRSGDVRGGVVQNGRPCVGTAGSQFTHCSVYPTATLFGDSLSDDQLEHDCVRDGCAPVLTHPEWLAKALASGDLSVPTGAESRSYTPWDPAAPADLSAVAGLNPSVARSIMKAGRALGVLIACQISHLCVRRALVLGPAEVVDERWTSARRYLNGARQAAANLSLGGPLTVEPLLRTADEIDLIAEWLDSG